MVAMCDTGSFAPSNCQGCPACKWTAISYCFFSLQPLHQLSRRGCMHVDLYANNASETMVWSPPVQSHTVMRIMCP